MATNYRSRYDGRKASPEDPNPYATNNGQEIWNDFIQVNEIKFHIFALSKCPFQFILGDRSQHHCGDSNLYCYYQARAAHLRGAKTAEERTFANPIQLPDHPHRLSLTNEECYMGKPTHIELPDGIRIATSHKCPAESDECATYRDALLANTGLTWVQTSPNGNWYHPGYQGTVLIGKPETISKINLPCTVTIARRGATATPYQEPLPLNQRTTTTMPCEFGKHCDDNGKAVIHLTNFHMLVCVKCAANEEGQKQWQVRYDMNFKDYDGAHWADQACRTREC